jgi:hypothetical protein
MHLSIHLTSFTLFASSTLALAQGYGNAAPPTSTVVSPDSFTTPPNPNAYILKTRVRNGTDPSLPVTDDCKAKYSNLYLWAYHTGAGLNDAVVSSNRSLAITGFLNVTDTTAGKTEGFQEFNLSTPFPWGFALTIGTYNGWGEVQINAGAETPGFFFTEQHGLRLGGNGSTIGGSFGGWLGECPSLLCLFASCSVR